MLVAGSLTENLRLTLPHLTHARQTAPLDGADLVARIRDGDERACEALYLAYHEPLWRFAFGFVRSRSLAEEFVQEVFLSLWKGRANWMVRTSVRAWLYAAVRHHALNHVRHQRVVRKLHDCTDGAINKLVDEAAPIAMGTSQIDPQAAIEERELNEAAARAISSLSEGRRVAMTLRWKHDLSASEIAHVLGTSPESVRVLLTRARRELVGLLEQIRE